VGRHYHEDRAGPIRELFEPSHEFSQLYDYPGMRADPDLLGAFGCPPVNSICRPSTLVTSASPLTKRPTGVAAR
jgi:hypothetical protein